MPTFTDLIINSLRYRASLLHSERSDTSFLALLYSAMSWFSILPAHLTVVETWIIRFFVRNCFGLEKWS